MTDESHFQVQGQHSRFVSIRNKEQLSPAQFQWGSKTPPKEDDLGQF